ncbi:Uncharacterised protein [Dermatophilus congolensis]|uniref:Lipid A core - O-antigen ligase and related enzymes n=1 Tax=Dermatophilus congolensis TaxID=1863 RepID=A0A239VUU3_9MICO|nr:Uncharacterised protein [Dermatophilus congolensis]
MSTRGNSVSVRTLLSRADGERGFVSAPLSQHQQRAHQRFVLRESHLAVERESKSRYPSRLLDPVWWIGVLFVANFFLMRLSVPGIDISLSVPLTIVWLGLAWRCHVIVVEPRRFLLWVAAGGVAALVTFPQILFVPAPYVSVNSWLLWMVTWLPAAFMMADRSRGTFERALRAVKNIGLGLASISVLFMVVQATPIGYRDFIGESLPSNLVVSGFNTSYPLFYEANIYKSNGWFALEPSFMSFILGLCILAALLIRARIWEVMVLSVGMLVTAAGSGMFVALIGVVVMLWQRQWPLLRRYLIPGLVLAAVAAPTTIGKTILDRLSEGSSENSSTALRTFEPYLYLFPKWVSDWGIVLFGGGPGSSRYVVDASGVNGLLVPTVGKVFFDYGLIAGALLAVIIVVSYVKATEPAIGMSVLVSMLVLQPPAQPLMVPAFLLSTLWAPALRDNILAGTERLYAPRGVALSAAGVSGVAGSASAAVSAGSSSSERE